MYLANEHAYTAQRQSQTPSETQQHYGNTQSEGKVLGMHNLRRQSSWDPDKHSTHGSVVAIIASNAVNCSESPHAFLHTG